MCNYERTTCKDLYQLMVQCHTSKCLLLFQCKNLGCDHPHTKCTLSPVPCLEIEDCGCQAEERQQPYIYSILRSGEYNYFNIIEF